MDTFVSDVRYAISGWRRAPAVAAAAIVTLAVAIGGATTIFTFANAVVLRPLPFERSHELVALQPENDLQVTALSPGGFLDWQTQHTSFERLAAFHAATATLTGGGEPEAVSAAVVTSEFFETLRVAPIVGRTFATFAGTADMEQAVLISASLWRRRFQSDPRIEGRSITLDGRLRVVAGVLPDDFDFPRDLLGSTGRLVPRVDLWLPLLPRATDRSNAFLQVIGRLKPGVTVQRAALEMSSVAARLDDRSSHDRPSIVRVTDLHTRVVRDVRSLLLTLLGAVGFVLMIGCANVANLLMIRATGRRREMAIRTALGAPRRRLARQLLTESVVLGVTGGAAGVLIAYWSVDLVRAIIPPNSLPRLSQANIDLAVLGFAFCTSVLTGVLFGLVPAVRASGTDVSTPLKASSANQSARSRVLDLLVASEVALACVLLIAAALMLKSFVKLASVDPGFTHRDTLALAVNLPPPVYDGVEDINRFASDVLARFRALPGVQQAGVVNWLPFGGGLLRGSFSIDGDPAATRGIDPAKLAISPGYFGAIGITTIAGRDFEHTDTGQSLRVAIVSDRLARRLWPTENPIGKRVRLGRFGGASDPWLEVVGIVAEVRQQGLADDPDMAIYVPLAQTHMPPMVLRSLWFAVETRGEGSATATALRRELLAVDPSLPIAEIPTMDALVSSSIATPRFRTILFTSFAIVGAGLVLTGVFGVVTYYVAQRFREIGVRLALGARSVDIMLLVLKRAAILGIEGAAVGVAAAAILMRLLSEYLFQVDPDDAATFAAVVVGIVSLTLAAAYIPAWRAGRVDPLSVLRSE